MENDDIEIFQRRFLSNIFKKIEAISKQIESNGADYSPERVKALVNLCRCWTDIYLEILPLHK